MYPFNYTGRLASWLVYSLPYRALRVPALAANSLLSQGVYKRVTANFTLRGGRGGGGVTLWSSMPYKGRRNISSRFMILKVE